MQITKQDKSVVQQPASQAKEFPIELDQLELSMVGGGMGDIVLR
jgi:hypothetical protein